MPPALYSKKALSIFGPLNLVLPDSRTLRNEFVLYRLPHPMYPDTETQDKSSRFTHSAAIFVQIDSSVIQGEMPTG